MKLVFESTEIFENEIDVFDNEQRSLIVNQINSFFYLLLSNPEDFYSQVEQPSHFPLNNDYESSLYMLKINDNLKFIFTLDEDPIFERIIISLFRLIKTNEAVRAYEQAGYLLYHDFLSKDSKKVPVLA